MYHKTRSSLKAFLANDRYLTMVRFIRSYRRKHGYSPNTRELADFLETSTSVVAYYLKSLVKWGRIKITPAQARTIVPIGTPGRMLLPRKHFRRGYPVHEWEKAAAQSVVTVAE